MQWIVCELGNLTINLKDIKGNHSTKCKNLTMSLQFSIDRPTSFSPLSVVPNLVTSFYMANWKKFRTSQPSFLSILGLNFWGGCGKIYSGSNNHKLEESACNLYGSYALRTPMAIL